MSSYDLRVSDGDETVAVTITPVIGGGDLADEIREAIDDIDGVDDAADMVP